MVGDVLAPAIVVGGEDDDGVVEFAALVDSGENVADAAVDVFAHGGVVLADGEVVGSFVLRGSFL